MREEFEKGAPFDRVNVEEVYDGIQGLANRDADILSDFVSGWEPTLGSMRMNISGKDVKKAFETLLASYQTSKFSRRKEFAFGPNGPRAVQELLLRAFDPATIGEIGGVESSFQRALVKSLLHANEKIGYFQRIIEIAKENGADVVT